VSIKLGIAAGPDDRRSKAAFSSPTEGHGERLSAPADAARGAVEFRVHHIAPRNWRPVKQAKATSKPVESSCIADRRVIAPVKMRW